MVREGRHRERVEIRPRGDGAGHSVSRMQLQANPDLAGAVWVVIEVDVERYPGYPAAQRMSSR